MTGPTVLLTGLPRSGTTLTCELLNRVSDTVALDEPMDWNQFTGREPPGSGGLVARGLQRARARVGRLRAGIDTAPSHDAICDNIESFCRSARTSIRATGSALSRHVDGKVMGSKVADYATETGLRARLAERGEVAFAQTLSPSFLLVIKHNSGFTALLERLPRRLPVYAVVRNPLSILSSWQTVPFPPQSGHVAMGEAFDPVLAAALSAIDDRLERQLHLLEWFFSRFTRLLPSASVIRYEDLIVSGGAALSVITANAAGLAEPLENRNVGRAVYDAELAHRLGRRLLDGEGSWRAFYDDRAVEEILAV